MFFHCFIANCQKYGNVWQFGSNVGLDFNGCSPIVTSGNNTGFEGCSAISNSNGQLLFYTNSDVVWDSSNNIMPNGNLISSGGTLSQVLIIPKPSSVNFFYVITTKIQAGGSLSLQYHEVDISLNGGLGDVTSKNNILSALNVTEQICATYHNNGTDIWLVAHEYGTNNFLSFLVTPTGISGTPIVSSVGPAHTACLSNINARGEIKFSPNGDKLAFNANGVGGNDLSNILILCDFDNATGIVSNALNLPFSKGEYGLSFSPNGSKLYGATWKAANFTTSEYNYLYQFDISSGVPSTIINSRQILDSMVVPSSFGSLKIGPDGKIYVRRAGADYLGVINEPDSVGISCNYVKNGLYIGTQSYQYGLNNYIEYTQYCDGNTSDILTHESGIRIDIYPNPFAKITTIRIDERWTSVNIIVLDISGRVVRKMEAVSGGSIPFDKGNLKSGMYFLFIDVGEISIGSARMIVID